eukprot:scaffold64724_cov55-Cyclotella_meneghiniana.AAC.2
MKHAELKHICKDNKLLISGAKSVLVQRILEYEQSQSVLPEERNNDSNVTESNTNETPISSVLGPNDIEVEDTFGYESVYGNQVQDEEEEYNEPLFLCTMAWPGNLGRSNNITTLFGVISWSIQRRSRPETAQTGEAKGLEGGCSARWFVSVVWVTAAEVMFRSN